LDPAEASAGVEISNLELGGRSVLPTRPEVSSGLNMPATAGGTVFKIAARDVGMARRIATINTIDSVDTNTLSAILLIIVFNVLNSSGHFLPYF